jgi:hypothetical protein
MKIRSVGGELYHVDLQADRKTDGRIDRYDEGNSHFSQFVKAPKEEKR